MVPRLAATAPASVSARVDRGRDERLGLVDRPHRLLHLATARRHAHYRRLDDGRGGRLDMERRAGEGLAGEGEDTGHRRALSELNEGSARGRGLLPRHANVLHLSSRVIEI